MSKAVRYGMPSRGVSNREADRRRKQQWSLRQKETAGNGAERKVKNGRN